MVAQVTIMADLFECRRQEGEKRSMEFTSWFTKILADG